MIHRPLIQIVMLSLFFSFYLLAQFAVEDRLRSVIPYTPSLELNRFGVSPYKNATVFLILSYQEDETEEKESEGFLHSRYSLLYQGTALLLFFLLIRRLMGRRRKPVIQDEKN